MGGEPNTRTVQYKNVYIGTISSNGASHTGRVPRSTIIHKAGGKVLLGYITRYTF